MKTAGIFCFLFFLAQAAYSQDYQFANTNSSLVYLNPSYAGSNGGLRNQTSYKNQWPLLSSGYVTYLNSLDFYIRKLRAGVALTLSTDDQAHGTLKTTGGGITYAQYLTCKKSNLQIVPSVQVLYGQKTLDLNALHFGDPLDPRYGFVWSNPGTIPSSRVSYTDFSAGILTRYKDNFHLGAYLFHINQPDAGLMGENKLPSRLVLHAAYTKNISETNYIQFFYRFQKQQNFTSSQLSVQLLLRKHFVTGMSYMQGDAVFINLGFRSEYFSLIGGYEMTVSRLAGNTAGSWELHLGFDLRKKENRGKFHHFEN